MAIPDDLLLKFFREAIVALDEHTYNDSAGGKSGAEVPPPPLAQQRQDLLGVQRSCLRRVVSNYNDESGTTFSVEQVQTKLKDLGSCTNEELKESMSTMNDSARRAFCRVVLQVEWEWDVRGHKSVRQLRKEGDGSMERSAIIEFCGLCSAAVRLPNVQKHLRDGTPLYECSYGPLPYEKEELSDSQSLILAQKRLENIQRLFFRAVGYDADYASAEIQRIFLASNDNYTKGSFADDVELHEMFAKCASSLTVAVTNASLHGNTEKLSDQDEGGVTRVVSVQYSEKIVNPSGPGDWRAGGSCHEQTIGAPGAESIKEHVEQRQQQELELARQAAAMQQGILGELLSMDEQDREANLQLAKEAHDEFLKGALELPPGPERVQYLRSVDPETQRFLVMHKLWASMLAENGGVAPTIRHS